MRSALGRRPAMLVLRAPKIGYSRPRFRSDGGSEQGVGVASQELLGDLTERVRQRWEDVDFEKRTLRIGTTRVDVGGRALGQDELKTSPAGSRGSTDVWQVGCGAAVVGAWLTTGVKRRTAAIRRNRSAN